VSTAPDEANPDHPGGPAVGPFERFAAADVRALIAGFPLAWVCAPAARPFQASLLPLIGEYDAEGGLTALIGHLGKRNPLVPALTAEPRAAILFKGPDGYISPEHAGRRDWAPTWNYAQLTIEAEMRFDEAMTEDAVARLVETMEAGRRAPWRSHELGARYAGMARQIIGFRAEVKRLTGRFKLGQDETPETLGAIVTASEDPALALWMRRMNGGR
jgi:transcriptional regulator